MSTLLINSFFSDSGVTLDEIKEAILDEINAFKVKNKEKTYDKAALLKPSTTEKMDPKFQKLQEAQAKMSGATKK